jgi:translocation and assembly module TamA
VPNRSSAQLAVLAAAWGVAGTAGCAHDETEIGTGVWVHSLRIEGNKALSDGDISDRLSTQETGWWPFASKKWFDQAAFDQDLQRIPALYADHGYFDARVLSHDVAKHGKSGVDVVVRVQESAPTRIQEVAIAGLPPDQEAGARKLAHAGRVEAGRIFDYGGFTSLKSGVADRLREAGYAYAAVEGEVRVDRDRHTAAVSITARPGPKVRLGRVQVEGNGAIPAHAIENRVTWRAGDTFEPRALSTTQGRIYELGVFSSVRLELPKEPVEIADVRIIAHPGLLRELRIGGGVAVERLREQVRLRFEYTRNNFLGGLRKLRLRLRPGYVVIPSVLNVQRSGFASDDDLQLTQPDLFGSNVTGHALVGYDLGVAEGYDYRGPRAQVAFDRPFLRDRLLAGGSWNIQYLTFTNVDTDVFNQASNRFFGFENPYRLAYLEGFGQVDLRDRPLEPTVGAFFAARGEFGHPALGGQFHYVKITPDLRVYAPVVPRVVGAVRGLFGWLHPYSGQQSPITRRYYLGGPASHRGFGLGRLAPQAVDTAGNLIPIGGNAEVLFSGELRIAVTKLGGNWVRLVPFVDAGDATPSFATLELGHLHYATGLSAEYGTPIGSIRAGLGVRLNRMGDGNPDPNQRVAFHITIGEAF